MEGALMKFVCKFDLDINECPFFKRESLECCNEKDCTYREELKNLAKNKADEEYIREPRWYEKYYK